MRSGLVIRPVLLSLNFRPWRISIIVQLRFTDYEDAQDVDIAIIGTGISGLYCALEAD